jgi:hypothetical protein
MMIHTDLFGQKEEVEKKKFLIHDDIPTETRQKVFFVISENAYHLKNERSRIPSLKKVEDLSKLRHNICKHKGIQDVSKFEDNRTAINKWIRGCSKEDFLRTVEIFIEIRCEDSSAGYQKRLDNTINEINEIFKIDKIGYEIVSRRFIQKDSEFIQEQVTKKAITLLYTNDFKGPLEEFQKALDHYIRKEYKSTIQEANNSFESTMKSVLTKSNISFDQSGSAELLLDLLCKNEIIYTYTKAMFQGLPKLRNKHSAHGQGIDPKEVNQSYAELALNLAGSFIVFLINRYHELKR